ncbi:MAG: DNA gyrase subunit A [Patescibacteria group bacterium]|jgi:DNA gyrase subunit A
MEIGLIRDRKIIDEMQESYLDYAMSVIVSRALPDVRDGLKPVHRRILYAMWDIGLRANAKFRKSATVVGEVLGKYHPHGDTAVYDSLVRLAQEFSMRDPLVNGQGNFGSVDGDSAAAMRYTECKLTKIAEEMLFDIDKETVNFIDNYDGSHKEPQILPAKLPNTLINGTMGIAVGMATNIPPHNLIEIADAINCLIENKDAGIEDLMQFVKGPDFPTGGVIFNKKEILQVYATGKGGIVMRGVADIEETKKGAFRIIITAIPYQVNKATLIEKIADLVKNKKIDGIRDIRDESNKDGIRVVIELKKEAFPKKVLNRLYSLTQLQEKFHVNMLALVDGIKPMVLNLKMMLEEYIKHRVEIVTRRAQYDLRKAKEREHILEGLSTALDHIDEIIRIIKKSPSREVAHQNLMKRFKFSDLQTEAILEMRLSQLAALERIKIEDELKEKRRIIKELEELLGSRKKILGVVKTEVAELKEKYGTERNTKVIAGGMEEFKPEDLIPKEDIVISLTRGGYIKSLPEATYHAQKRGGKGVMGMATKEEDVVDHFFMTDTHADILFFTNSGKVFQLKAYEIPKATRQAKGQSIVNFLQLSSEEKVTALISLDKTIVAKYLVMVTKQGVIKKVTIEDFNNVRRSGLIAIKIKPGDELEWVKLTTGSDQVVLITQKGQSIRFKEKDVRAMGRTASGVRGMKLKNGDLIVSMDVISEKVNKDQKMFVITEKGYGKTTKVSAYKIQGRGGSGVKTAKITSKNGPIVAAGAIDHTIEELIIISSKGAVIRISADAVPEHGRATQGVRVMRLEAGDKVASVAYIKV